MVSRPSRSIALSSRDAVLFGILSRRATSVTESSGRSAENNFRMLTALVSADMIRVAKNGKVVHANGTRVTAQDAWTAPHGIGIGRWEGQDDERAQATGRPQACRRSCLGGPGRPVERGRGGGAGSRHADDRLGYRHRHA